MAPIPYPSDSSSLQHWSHSLLPSLTYLHSALSSTLLAIQSVASSPFTHPPHLSPSSPTPPTASFSHLQKRQTVVAIPATYSGLTAGPPPGVVAGIVLGSVGGTLIVLWLIYTIFSLGGTRPSADEIDIIRRTRSRSPPRRTARRSETRSEVIEVSRHRTPPPPRERRREREIIVEETTTRRQQSVPPPMEEVEDDIVEVIEEHSPPPQRRSRRVSSGYRNVDPEEYGGGGRRTRPVR